MLVEIAHKWQAGMMESE